MKFNQVFHSLRKSRNMTQEELAKALGVSRSTIGMYEQGKREPDFETEEKIADYFNVTLDYLRSGKYSEVRMDGQSEYYTESTTADEAQGMLEDKVMRSLYRIKRNMDPEKFQVHYDSMKQLYLLEHPEEHPEDFE